MNSIDLSNDSLTILKLECAVVFIKYIVSNFISNFSINKLNLK